MNIIPAIDLKNNKCVRLSKGKDNSSIIFNDDPVKQAIFFEKIGDKNTSRDEMKKNLIKQLEANGFKIKNKK